MPQSFTRIGANLDIHWLTCRTADWWFSQTCWRPETKSSSKNSVKVLVRGGHSTTALEGSVGSQLHWGRILQIWTLIVSLGCSWRNPVSMISVNSTTTTSKPRPTPKKIQERVKLNWNQMTHASNTVIENSNFDIVVCQRTIFVPSFSGIFIYHNTHWKKNLKPVCTN